MYKCNKIIEQYQMLVIMPSNGFHLEDFKVVAFHAPKGITPIQYGEIHKLV